MKYNLENIPKTEVVRSDGLTYLDFRKSLSPHYNIVWQDIGLAYFYIFLSMILSFSLESLLAFPFWVFIPFLSLITGFCIAHLRLFVHEAVHENIHVDKKKNDLLANIFLCSWFGISLQGYRKSHWKHHYLLGTTEDSENSYFKKLSIELFISYLTGVYGIKNKFQQIKKLLLNKAGRKTLWMASIGIILNSGILCFCIYVGHWQSAVVWFLATAIFFPLFSEIRQILEHRNEWADPNKDFSKENHGKTCRLFEASFMSNFFGAAGFNRHLLHHWDPHISYTQYDELEDYLMDTSQCRVSIYGSTTTYFDTFLFLIIF
ncbi:MAG: fatty acid desaturase [Saprospiraceae bacterium]|jgi:fatty acid desaturase